MLPDGYRKGWAASGTNTGTRLLGGKEGKESPIRHVAQREKELNGRGENPMGDRSRCEETSM